MKGLNAQIPMDKIFIVIPAKDEGTRLGSVLHQAKKLGYGNIVVVDDGSADNTFEIASTHGAIALKHYLNLGAGAATQTGIQYALDQGADIIVTLDADHQHLPSDIKTLIDKLRQERVDVVIGNRFLGNNQNIPTLRIFYNKVGNYISYLFTGLYVGDSQSGMKAMRADFARKSIIRRNGFEFCMEIIRYIKINKASWCEAPINVVYTKETMSKGQGFFTGIKMVLRMIKFHRWIF